ncbi:hypothetical protein L1987_34615 [Smallanthus sonchifolius]|uniref:Uncharacterized protein n=1 Tax=Smallanthus sonchifolius TaxID=185202 RepID=A0ACB9HUQ7_9ASTR|nr:hypothetical protein L1987_34615 [Smallanthus sonchifolius]
MGAFYNTSEIVELEENSDFQSNKPQKRFYIEDDINSLFESVRISAKTTGLPQALKDKHKKSMKRPMRVSPYQSPQIGISGPVNLKQALRGLTISQASEMAAMKRLSKPTGFPGGPIKRSQIAAGVEVNDKVNHQTMVEVSVVPERASSALVTELVQSRNLKLKLSSLSTRSRRKLSVVDEIQPDPVEIKKKPDNKADEKLKSREKGEFSQSSKSSVGECSSSTSFSCDSNASAVSRPHMSKDLRWEAVYNAQKKYGNLNIRNFKLIKKLGGGDIGTVYLAELIGSDCFFALKILDNELLGLKKKATRAQTEREILQLLDHPFLPTLFSQFTTDKYSCLVIEYCPGGDLHVLRQKQPNKCFSEQATRFYVAEILLALEYLHMLGVVYRDLKPENILVREDGHILLTDFDLSLRCDPNPTLVKPMSPLVDRPKETESSCIDPFCLQPSWQVPCFTPKMSAPKLKSDMVVQVSPLPELVVEPTGARSNSFVGTHEYLAPEIIKGEGHGSQVDWWTFGILLYELLYGRTPFKGTGDDDTLANVVSQGLEFPNSPLVSFHARDLIKSLLQKQPENRLGSSKGAAEIKQHRFFEGMNWALIRCATPPEVPKICDVRSACRKGTSENLVFDLF